MISDEAHRSIGGNSRAVCEYFIGYKLGLTATPKDYLKNVVAANPTIRDPREAERRLLLDIYRTFGCEDNQSTVGMMTTGYDCPDILNLGLFRPIFSPTDFIQIKGRGTRKHDFADQLFDDDLKATLRNTQKTSFKLFDFFANCEYFEEEFDYDQVIRLPQRSSDGDGGIPGDPPLPGIGGYEDLGDDLLSSIKEEPVGLDGMKIDRMFFNRFEESVRGNDSPRSTPPPPSPRPTSKPFPRNTGSSSPNTSRTTFP